MGVTTKEYLVHSTPVAKIASCWYGDISSAGFCKSPMLEKVIIHLNVGAQKKTINKRSNTENHVSKTDLLDCQVRLTH